MWRRCTSRMVIRRIAASKNLENRKNSQTCFGYQFKQNNQLNNGKQYHNEQLRTRHVLRRGHETRLYRQAGFIPPLPLYTQHCLCVVIVDLFPFAWVCLSLTCRLPSPPLCWPAHTSTSVGSSCLRLVDVYISPPPSCLPISALSSTITVHLLAFHLCLPHKLWLISLLLSRYRLTLSLSADWPSSYCWNDRCCFTLGRYRRQGTPTRRCGLQFLARQWFEL